MSKKTLCHIYRSPREEGMYLYVAKPEALDDIPEALLKRFGKPQHAMTIAISRDKKLARADAKKVLEAIGKQGFYLQLPPLDDSDAYMQQVNVHNHKLRSGK